MLSRRSMLITAGKTFASLACLPVAVLFARRSEGQVPRGPVLEDRLLRGLRVKRASDKRFIALIVELVQRGVLPVKLVDTTFFWARSKAAKKRGLANNPMVYFRPALIARASRLGIRI